MLLTIDVGNTKTHFGLFRGKKLIRHKSVETRNIKKEGLTISKADSVAICSVVPEMTPLIKKKIKVPYLIVNHKTDLGLKIKYKNPGKVGADRLANAVAAKFIYGCPALVVDFGTAITIDVISKEGDYLGGVIMPGLDIIRYGLSQNTALLPLVPFVRTRRILGKNTEEAIQSGMFYGIRGMVKELIMGLKKQLHLPAKTVIISTGGYSDLIGKGIGKVDKYLTLKGLRIIYERHQ